MKLPCLVLFSAVLLSCATRKYTRDFGLKDISETQSHGEPLAITNSLEENFDIDVSPNGAYIFYSSLSDSNLDIFRKKTLGGIAERVTSHPAQDFSPVQSPNGKSLIYISRRDDALGDIYLISLAPFFGGDQTFPEVSAQRIPLVNSEEMTPVWFPDSRRVAFVSRDIKSKNEVIKIFNFAKNRFEEPALISGSQPSISKDGNLIFFIDKGFVKSFSLKDRLFEAYKELDLAPTGSIAQSPDGQEIVLSRYSDDTNGDQIFDAQDKPSLWIYNLAEKQLRPITPAGNGEYRPRWKNKLIYFDSLKKNSVDVFVIPDRGLTAFDAKSQRFLVPEEKRSSFIFKLRAASSTCTTLGLGDDWLTYPLAEFLDHLSEIRYLEALVVLKTISAHSIQLNFSEIETDFLNFFVEHLDQLIPFSKMQFKGKFGKKVDLFDEFSQERGVNKSLFFRLLRVLLDLSNLSGKSSFEDLAQLSSFTETALLSSSLSVFSAHMRGQIYGLASGVKFLLSTYQQLPDDSPDKRDIGILGLRYIQKYQVENKIFGQNLETYYSNMSLHSEEKALAGNSYAKYLFSINSDSAGLALTNDICFDDRQIASQSQVLACQVFASKTESFVRLAETEKSLKKAYEISKKIDRSIQLKCLELLSLYYERRANVSLLNNDLDTALLNYEQVKKLNPKSILARIGSIEVGARQFRFEELEKQELDFLKTDDGDLLENLLIGILYLRWTSKVLDVDLKKKYSDKAVVYLEKARDRDSGEGRVYKYLGLAYSNRWELIQSIRQTENFSQSIKNKANQVVDYFGQGEDALKKAIKAYESSLYFAQKDSQEEADVQHLLANLYYDQQLYPKALIFLEKRITNMKYFPLANQAIEAETFWKAGKAAYQSDQLALAEKYFEKSAKLYEDLGIVAGRCSALDFLGLVQSQSGNFLESANSYSLLLDLQNRSNYKKNSFQSELNLGSQLYYLRKYKEAFDMLQTAKTHILGSTDKLGDTPKSEDKISLDLSGSESSENGFSKDEKIILINSFLIQIYQKDSNILAALSLLAENSRTGEALFSQKKQNKWLQFLVNTKAQSAQLYIQLDQLAEGITNYKEAWNISRRLRLSVNKKGPPSNDEMKLTLNLLRTALIANDLIPDLDSIKTENFDSFRSQVNFDFGDSPIPYYWEKYKILIVRSFKLFDISRSKSSDANVFDFTPNQTTGLGFNSLPIFYYQDEVVSYGNSKVLAEKSVIALDDLNLSWKYLFYLGETDLAFKELLSLKTGENYKDVLRPSEKLFALTLVSEFLEKHYSNIGSNQTRENLKSDLIKIENFFSECDDSKNQCLSLKTLNELSRKLDLSAIVVLRFTLGNGRSIGFHIKHNSKIEIFADAYEDNSKIQGLGDFLNGFSTVYLSNIGFKDYEGDHFSRENNISTISNVPSLSWLTARLSKPSSKGLCVGASEDRQRIGIDGDLTLVLTRPTNSFVKDSENRLHHLNAFMESLDLSCAESVSFRKAAKTPSFSNPSVFVGQFSHHVLEKYDLNSLVLVLPAGKDGSSETVFFGLPLSSSLHPEIAKKKLLSKISKIKDSEPELLAHAYFDLGQLEFKLGDERQAKLLYRKSGNLFQKAKNNDLALNALLLSRDDSWTKNDLYQLAKLAIRNNQAEVFFILNADFELAKGYLEWSLWLEEGMLAAQNLGSPEEEFVLIQTALEKCGNRIGSEKCLVNWNLKKADYLFNRIFSIADARSLLLEIKKDSNYFFGEKKLEEKWLFLFAEIELRLGNLGASKKAFLRLENFDSNLGVVERWHLLNLRLELAASSGDLLGLEAHLEAAESSKIDGGSSFLKNCLIFLRSISYRDRATVGSRQLVDALSSSGSFSLYQIRIASLLYMVAGDRKTASEILAQQVSKRVEQTTWASYLDFLRYSHLKKSSSNWTALFASISSVRDKNSDLFLNLIDSPVFKYDDPQKGFLVLKESDLSEIKDISPAWSWRYCLGLAKLSGQRGDSRLAEKYFEEALEIVSRAPIGVASRPLFTWGKEPQLDEFIQFSLSLTEFSIDRRFSIFDLLESRGLYDDQLWSKEFSADQNFLKVFRPFNEVSSRSSTVLALMWQDGSKGGVLARGPSKDLSLIFDKNALEPIDLLNIYWQELSAGRMTTYLDNKLLRLWVDPLIEALGSVDQVKIITIGNFPSWTSIADEIRKSKGEYPRLTQQLFLGDSKTAFDFKVCNLQDKRTTKHSHSFFWEELSQSFGVRKLTSKKLGICQQQNSTTLIAIDEKTKLFEKVEEGSSFYFDSALVRRDLVDRYTKLWQKDNHTFILKKSDADVGLEAEQSLRNLVLTEDELLSKEKEVGSGLILYSN